MVTWTGFAQTIRGGVSVIVTKIFISGQKTLEAMDQQGASGSVINQTTCTIENWDDLTVGQRNIIRTAALADALTEMPDA